MKPRIRRLFTLRNLMIGVASAGILGGAGIVVWKQRATGLPHFATAQVHRQTLEVKLRAGGKVDSTKKTLIECELQRLSYSANGNRLSAGGASTILEVLPDGTNVHKDDIICRLDSSEYEELVRQQEIKVETARSEHRRAELDLLAAEAGLREYRDGLMAQTRQSFAGTVTLGKADLTKQEERLKWARAMAKIGYLPASKLGDEERSYLRLENSLATSIRDRDHFLNYGSPRDLATHESKVFNAKTNLDFQFQRLKRQEDRLQKFRDQVELCTIRAPHDGFLIHANDDDDDPRIDVGVVVRQKMDLFYLPDLSHMEVATLLHESILSRVKDGMPARVRVESLPNYVLEGRVVSIAPLPSYRSVPTSLDVMNYVGHIQLNGIPEGLLPGMSAEVEILTQSVPDALVIPSEALGYDSGREFCYVAGADFLERREVTVGETSENLLEVTAGLSEGEKVVLNPGEVADTVPEYLVRSGTADHHSESAESPTW
jgi:HlyD family secretion protein